jgi:hypothetical protein
MNALQLPTVSSPGSFSAISSRAHRRRDAMHVTSYQSRLARFVQFSRDMMKIQYSFDSSCEYQRVPSPHHARQRSLQRRAGVIVSLIGRRIRPLVGTTIAAALISGCQPRVSPSTTTPAPACTGDCVTYYCPFTEPAVNTTSPRLGCGPPFACDVHGGPPGCPQSRATPRERQRSDTPFLDTGVTLGGRGLASAETDPPVRGPSCPSGCTPGMGL